MEAISLFVQPKPELSTAIEAALLSGELPAKQKVLRPGEFLFHEGESVLSTYYIERGLARLYSSTPDGYTKTVFFHKAGTLIGFQGFQQTKGSKPSILNACATTKTELFEIASKAFGAYLQKHSDVCYSMAQYLFEMMAMQTREAVNSSIYPVRQRFAALLLTLMNEFGAAQAPAIVPFSNDDLAGMLGVHVNSITNSVVALRKAECVERQRGALVITDFKKLKSIAENLITNKK